MCTQEVKPFKTYKEQVDILRERGCAIADDAVCENVLSQVGYYRLSAYFLPFKDADGAFSANTSFDRVYKLYEFDCELRSILFKSIETIEVDLRSRLSYFHAQKYGPLGYMNPVNFNDKHDADRFHETIENTINNNSKVLFVKHHIDKYGRKFPLWVISELFTFGNLSHFYSDLTTADKKAFAGVHYRDMVSWLKCCTDLRNICAHYGRLYYRVFPSTPRGFNLNDNAARRLWGAILVVKALHPSSSKWNTEVLATIQALFEKYDDYIDLYHIAFPQNWSEQLGK